MASARLLLPQHVLLYVTNFLGFQRSPFCRTKPTISTLSSPSQERPGG